MLQSKTSRRGENRASVLSVFEKNVVFAIAKLLTFISKILEFSRGKSSGFNIMACKLQGFLCWKLARIFSLSAAHALVQHATSFLQNIFFGVHPTRLPNSDASHQLRIDVAVHPGRKATGNCWFRQPPHWIHSTCVNQDRFAFNSFLDAEDSLGVVTFWHFKTASQELMRSITIQCGVRTPTRYMLHVANQIWHSKICSRVLHQWARVLDWLVIAFYTCQCFTG